MVAFVCLLGGSLPAEARAQAGRRRQPPPPPKQERPLPPAKGEAARSETTSSAAPKKGTEIAEELNIPEMATTRVRLKNGLRLVIRERYSLPLAALVVMVQGGRLDESETESGLARLAERMLFRKTAERPAAGSLVALQSLGAVFGSATEEDHTVFHLTVPAENARSALEILADALQHPAFDADELTREVEALRWEEAADLDRPDVFSLSRAVATAFADHRLGRSRPLFENSLAAVTPDVLRDFYRRHYRAEKIVIAIVGAVNTVEMIEAARSFFGDFEFIEPEKPAAQPTPPPTSSSDSMMVSARDSPSAPSLAGAAQSPLPPVKSSPPALRYAVDRGDISLATVTIVHRTAGMDSTDGPALEVLRTVLGQGRASRLWRSLRQERGLVFEVGARTWATRDVGYLAVQLRLDPENLDRAETAYFEEIERLRREWIAPGELQRAKSLIEQAYWQQLITFAGEARRLATDELFFHDFRQSDPFLTRLAAVQPEDVQKIAAALFLLGNTTLHEYLPEALASRSLTAEALTERIATQVPGVKESTLSPERLKRASDVTVVPQGQRGRPEGERGAVIFSLQPEPLRDFSVFEGPRAFVREDRRRPLVSVGVLFQGGRLFESAATAGLTELLLRVLLAGVGGRTPLSATEVALRLEQWGAHLTLVNEADFCGFVLSVLSRNQEAATRLLVDLIEHPAFRQEDVAREREMLLQEIRAVADDPVERSADMMAEGLYGDLPYGWPRRGRAETVMAFTREQVIAWYDRVVKKQLPVIVVVGDTDGSALISSIMAREMRREDLQRTSQTYSPTALSQPVTKVQHRMRRAAVQTIGFLGPVGSSEEMAALTVWRQLACGLGGTVRRALRSRRGLSARLTAVIEPRRMGSMIKIVLISSPENETPARQALEQELTRHSETPLDESDLRQAIAAALGEEMARREHPDELLLEYARRFFLTTRPQTVETDEERLRAVTSAQLHRVVTSYLVPARRAAGILRPDEKKESPEKSGASSPLLSFGEESPHGRTAFVHRMLHGGFFILEDDLEEGAVPALSTACHQSNR